MSLKVEIEKVLTKFTGSRVLVSDFLSVSGGSINETYRLSTNSGDYFLKKNSSSRFPQMFKKEALGLKIMRKAREIDIPEEVGVGENGDVSFLLLKFIVAGSKSPSFWDDFGRQVANLHKHTNNYFGLDHDNYIGSLKQHNNKHNNWSNFFRDERLARQVKLARDNGRIDKETVATFDRYYVQLENLFPVEMPALLHGDLWGGNFMVNNMGSAVIFDPAVYYGHREMDLGMSKLFGGFDKQFYISYNKHFPLENGWEKRLDYCNLYPLLVHINLFGGGYTQSVKEIIRKF